MFFCFLPHFSGWGYFFPYLFGMNRRKFIQQSSLATAGVFFSAHQGFAQANNFPTVRVEVAKRKFTSKAVESLVVEISNKIGNKEIGWLFTNCFPNTLDTTVEFDVVDNKPDTYVITGDIDAMWLRDSTAQVWPYLPLCKQDAALQRLVAGVINRQVKCILLDPYANAFYKDVTMVSEWKNDLTTMKPGVHERKWEIDSLCYPIRLSHGYWQATGDASIFDEQWLAAMRLIIKTFKEQQRFDSKGPYSFQRTTAWATDGVPLAGYGYPAKPNGLIHSMFRPSDDATIYPYLIPANFFAVSALRNLADMLDRQYRLEALQLATQIKNALDANAIIKLKNGSRIYAYEVNGFGSFNLMDDANVPSLLSLPYLGAVPLADPVYQNTRNYVLSGDNPFFYKGKAGEGIGGPHVGVDYIWPLSIIMRGLTSTSDKEIKACIDILQQSHAGTGFMHEAFYKDDAANFTRKWFAWANTLFGEFIWKIFRERPHLLN